MQQPINPRASTTKKVWTVCATYVEWIEYKHLVKTNAILELERKLEMLDTKISSARDSDKETLL